jgi:drug/metabolite transporter (DMT)-like permease
VLFTRAIRHLSALEASLLLLLEPVLNPMWAWLVHSEAPGAFTLAGGAVIISATALRAVTAQHS